MKKLFVLTAGIFMASSVFASNITLNQQTHMDAGTYQSREQALNAGFDLSDSLNSMSKSELRRELGLFSYTNVNNINIDDSQVVIKEVAYARDNIQYRAILNVDYHFNAMRPHD
ncbi:DUF3316 domain-containing protein [Vibrio sp. YIC-376]|uniref:DUF3316 domain-containing protein n=1 Tax=Vibrio sp. YIC-376 TaxID=3136162 RepID=UPI00402AA2B3